MKVQQLSDNVQYLVMARGAAADTSEDAAVLRDYFNLQACKLKDLCQEWSSRDERFRKIHIYFPGRQDPRTSSNQHEPSSCIRVVPGRSMSPSFAKDSMF